MKRIYTSRSLLTLLIITAFSLFGGGNFVKAQVALTESLIFEDFTNAGTGSYSSKSNFTLPIGSTSVDGWSTTDSYKQSNASSTKLQMKKSTGQLTSPLFNSSAGYTVKVTYGSKAALTLTIGSQTATGTTNTSPTTMSCSVELTTTSTNTAFSIKTGSEYAIVSKIEIIPTASGPVKLATPTFDLSSDEYTIGKILTMTAPTGSNLVYSVNGGAEVNVADASAAYRFPTTGEFSVKAKSVPADGDDSKTESDWTEAVTYNVVENIVPSGTETNVVIWSETFDDENFANGKNYQLIDGATSTKFYNDNMAGGEAGELLINKQSTSKTNGAFIVTLNDLKNMYGQFILTYKANNGNCTVSTTTSDCSISDYTYDTTNKDASCTVNVPNGTSSLVLKFENSSSSNTRVDDFLLVSTKPAVANDYYPFTVSSAGLSTFAAQKAYVMPEGLEGGVVTINPDKADVAEVTYLYTAGDIVPAREALLLKGTPNADYQLMLSKDAGSVKAYCCLKPALTYDDISAGGDEKFYIFANDSEKGLGFYFQGATGDGSKVEGIYGKGYLSVSATLASVRGFRIGQGDVTGIETAVGGTTSAAAVYTLGGVRVAGSVESLPAGFYIVNGKKVLVK